MTGEPIGSDRELQEAIVTTYHSRPMKNRTKDAVLTQLEGDI